MRLRQYLQHCELCLAYQTKRHAPYGALQPILADALFHTFCLDFVLGLPLTSRNNDTLLTTTDKYSKRVALVPGNAKFTAKDWTIALYNGPIRHWGLPAAFISDRDPKFLSAFWTEQMDLKPAKSASTAFSAKMITYRHELRHPAIFAVESPVM